MKVHVDGAAVTLTKADFLASGGEARVFVRGDTAYKLYHEKSRALPAGKVQELAAIGDPRVVKPQRLILDGAGVVVGYTMRFVRDATVLCQLFPRAYRERNGLGPADMLGLVQSLRGAVESVHRAQCLVVDLNEMNTVVPPGWGEVDILDADSFQTPHYPATALMESVRDRHMADPRAFSEGTDWFAFAIVAFQLFVGIHPYKGKHPTLRDLDARMTANVSVLNPTVGVPKVCYPFTTIPQVFLDWFRAVLEQGRRVAPPSSLVEVVALVQHAHVNTTPVSGRVTVTLLEEYEEDIREVWSWLGQRIVLTAGALYVNHAARRPVHFTGAVPLCGRTVPAGVPELVDVRATGLRVDAVANTEDGRVHVRCGDQILEVELRALGGRVVVTTKLAATCLEHATRLAPGGAYQDLLGEPHVALFPAAGVARTVAVPAWKGFRLVDLRCCGTVAVALTERDGCYTRFVHRFDAGITAADTRRTDDVAPDAIDFAVLDTGIVALKTGDDTLEVFSNKMGSATLRTVSDPALADVWGLHADGSRLVFFRGNDLFQLRLT